jgi:hypothetical protein
VADEEFDSPDVILDLLGEGQCIADEARKALPQSVVEALDVIGFPGFLRDRFVALRRNDAAVYFILVRVKRGVVWQKGQCSWTEDGRRDRLTDLDALGRAVDSALAVSRGKIKAPNGGARYSYTHHKVQSRWSRPGYKLLLGEHTFIRKLCNRA